MSDQRIIKTISLKPAINEYAEILLTKHGYQNFSALVTEGIRALYDAAYPAYARKAERVQKTVLSKTERDAEARAERLRTFMELAAALEAVPVGGQWNPVMGEDQPVTYFTYNVLERFEQQLPLSWLTPEHVANQYSPSKEKVLALKAAGKTKW